MQQSVNQERQEDRADTRIGVDLAQDRRAQEEHDKKMAALAANGGVPTNVGEDQAAGHATQLINNVNIIKGAGRARPAALRPNLWEVGVSNLTDNPDALSWARSGDKGERQSVASSYDGILDSLIYLSTGAAATEDQVNRMKGSIFPSYFDGEKQKQSKRQRLEAAIAAARQRAGPADLKTQAALAQLEGSLDFMYDPATAKADAYANQKTIEDILPNPESKPSEGWETEDYPVEAQQAHVDWLATNPQASAQQYLDFRKQLHQQYAPEEVRDDTTMFGPEALEQTEQFLEWRRTPRNEGNSIPAIQYRRKLGDIEAFFNDEAQRPEGVVATNYANAMTLGIPELLAGEKGRRNFHRKNAENPWLSLTGDLIGSAGPGALLTKGVQKLLPKGLDAVSELRRANVIAGTGQGAVRGAAAAEEGERTKGALFGGGLATIGGVAGQAFGGGSRSFAPKTQQADLDQLAGVKEMTLFQTMGKGAMEEGLQGLPAVRKARANSLTGMNRDNVNRALANIDETLPKGVKTGREATAYLHDMDSHKYNQLRPKIHGDFDDKFAMATKGLSDEVLRSGDSLKVDLLKEIQASLRKFASGKYDGASFKDANGKLRQLSTDWAKVDASSGVVSPSAYHDMARVAEKFRGQLRAQVNRNDPIVGNALKKLDKAWAHKLRIEDASNRATATGIYSPQQLLTSIKKLDTSKGKGAFARGRAFDQKYAQAAENILGSTPPKEHGNLLQTMSMMYLMGRHPLAVGLPMTVGGVASYTPGVKQLVKLLVSGKRNPQVELASRSAVGQALRKYGTEETEEPETKTYTAKKKKD